MNFEENTSKHCSLLIKPIQSILLLVLISNITIKPFAPFKANQVTTTVSQFLSQLVVVKTTMYLKSSPESAYYNNLIDVCQINDQIKFANKCHSHLLPINYLLSS